MIPNNLNEYQQKLFLDIYKTVLHAKLSSNSDSTINENDAIDAAVRIALHSVDLFYRDPNHRSTVKEICERIKNRPIGLAIELPNIKDE